MERYDFDKVIDRRGSGAVKTDALGKVYGKDDLIPLWVADMDFETPDFIVNALKERLEHPVFGYTVIPEDYWQTVQKWIADRHGWETRCEWMTFIPGIVKGIGMAINALLEKDEKVIIQPPVYHPFRLIPQKNGREVVFNPLKEKPDGGYEMDFDNLQAICDSKCRMLILSNPHNPAGIVWSKDTLQKLATFCHSRGIIVISDEIHCDMALFGNKHIPFASVSEEAAACSITFGAPSKTFNIPGLSSSWCVVKNPELRKPFFDWLQVNEFSAPTWVATVATEAAYTQGEEWLDELIPYIEDNIKAVEKYCEENLPGVHAVRPQASFLVWLDCTGLGLKHDELIDLFVNHAHLALNDGEMFGKGGEGHMRLNVANSRKMLLDSLAQLKDAINSIKG